MYVGKALKNIIDNKQHDKPCVHCGHEFQMHFSINYYGYSSMHYNFSCKKYSNEGKRCKCGRFDCLESLVERMALKERRRIKKKSKRRLSYGV